MKNDSFPQEWHELFSAALNGALTEVEKARLAGVLKDNASARQLWFLYSDNECGLAELKRVRVPAAVAPRQPPRLGWLSWRPLTAAAAGIVIGLSGASLVFGYVGSYAGRAFALLQESFESGPRPESLGMPVQSGIWSGDYSAVVGEEGGVRPPHGKKMLRFLRADYEGKPGGGGYVADLFRIVDLTSAEFEVTRGDACISVEARFRAVPQSGVRRGHCGVTVYALDELPEPGESHGTFLKRRDGLVAADDDVPPAARAILATTARQEPLTTMGDAWQAARSELRLPPGTRYVMIHLHQSLLQPRHLSSVDPVQFDGLFVDDVRVTLAHRPPLP